MKEQRHTQLQIGEPGSKIYISVTLLWLTISEAATWSGIWISRRPRSSALRVAKSLALVPFTWACWHSHPCSLPHNSGMSWTLRGGRDPKSLHSIASPMDVHMFSPSVLPLLETLTIRNLKNLAQFCCFLFCTHCFKAAFQSTFSSRISLLDFKKNIS